MQAADTARLHAGRTLRWGALAELLDRKFEPLLALFIFLTIFLPGSPHGINIKYPLYAALIPLAFLRCFHRNLATPGYLIALMAVPATLAAWIPIGLAYHFDTPSILRQFTDILLTILVCWFVQLAWVTNTEKSLWFLRLVVNASFATALAKLGLIAYAVATGMPVIAMVSAVDSFFGVELMTMSLGDLLGRFQLTADEIIPICIFLILRFREQLNFSGLRASVMILILTISVGFSYSRYFWMFAAVGFVMGLLLGKRDRFQATLIVLLIVLSLLSLPIVMSVYQSRFSAAVAGESDAQRTEQIAPLRNFFFDAPVLGHGLGSYTPVLLREYSPAGRYSYEVQLLALAGQIGLVGLAFLLGLLVFYFRNLFRPGYMRTSDRLCILVLLLAWLAAGAGNPLLFQPVAGVNYAALAALCTVLAPRSVQIDDQTY
jgi:O-antigen ligase